MHLKHLGLNRPQQPALAARQHGDHHTDSGSAATLISIVFVTAQPTFQGPVEGFSTNFGSAAVQTVPATQGVETINPQPTVVQTHAQPNPSHFNSHSPSFHTTFAQQSPSAAASTQQFNPTAANGAVASATSTPSSSAVGSSDHGMSGGAKAGIAIGVILGLGLLAGLAFVAIRAMKRRQEEREDEKSNPFGDSAAASPPLSKVTRGFTPPPVPPMSDFPRPSTAGTNGPNAPPSMHGTMAMSAVPSAVPSAAPSIRSMPPPEPPINPFGEHAQIGSQSSFNGSIPIGDATIATPTLPQGFGDEKEMIGAAIGGAAIGAAVGGAVTSEAHHTGPQPLELDGSRPVLPFAAVPASPSPSQYSFTSVAPPSAATAAAGSAGTSPSNVYRVQLDFHPSMHDEMELITGELVRMLHEYDDGWALCVKFDKSARGVCPRTCLSQKPLQPRRNGNRPGAGPRGPPIRTASPAPSNGPGNAPRPGPPGGSASPAPSQMSRPGLQGMPSRTASPAPPPGGFPTSRSASPAPGSGINPNLSNWPAKPINAATITPNLSNWPAQPVNFAGNDVKRSMSPGPYGGGPNFAAPRPQGPAKRRSHSMGNIPVPSPSISSASPMPSNATASSDALSPRAHITSDEFQLPIMGTPTSVSRKPLPL